MKKYTIIYIYNELNRLIYQIKGGHTMNLKNTKTEANLRQALAGESIARNKYSYFAEKAKREGNEEVAIFFEQLANNEKEHARLWYKLLYGQIGETIDNLKIAAEGEHDEWTDMYVQFAKDAEEEGFSEIAQLFKQVKRIERNHERENLKRLKKMTNEMEVEENESTLWMCGYCGFTNESKEVIEVCPLCKHPVIIL